MRFTADAAAILFGIAFAMPSFAAQPVQIGLTGRGAPIQGTIIDGARD
jgi:uncharacterized membrane protein YraQ (UPF0718 family)